MSPDLKKLVSGDTDSTSTTDATLASGSAATAAVPSIDEAAVTRFMNALAAFAA